MSNGTLNKGSLVKGVAGSGGGGGTTYTAGAGIEINNNNISVKKVNSFFEIGPIVAYAEGIESTNISIDNDTYLSQVGTPDFSRNFFIYDGENWKLDGQTITLATYGITITGTVEEGAMFFVPVVRLAGKTEYTMFADYGDFNTVFLNGLALNSDTDWYKEDVTEGQELVGRKIVFIDYELKSTDTIGVL